MLEYIDTVATPKKLSQILASNIDNGGSGTGLRIYARYCLKNRSKIKRSLQRPSFFHYLELNILDVWEMSNGFMTNWVTLVSL